MTPKNAKVSAPKKTSTGSQNRAEKMSLLRSMLGPDALERLQDKHVPRAAGKEPKSLEVSPERAAVLREKLLARFQETVPTSHAENAPRSNTAKGVDSPDRAWRASQTVGTSVDTRIASLADKDGLRLEHPAVIARFVAQLPRAQRVATIKTLPGPLARSVVRRIR